VRRPQDVALEDDDLVERAGEQAAHRALAGAAGAADEQERRAPEGVAVAALGTDRVARRLVDALVGTERAIPSSTPSATAQRTTPMARAGSAAAAVTS